jgi:hypothetical protein
MPDPAVEQVEQATLWGDAVASLGKIVAEGRMGERSR